MPAASEGYNPAAFGDLSQPLALATDTMTRLIDYLEVCERAARAGGAVLQDWAGRFEVKEKGRADLVTEADVASQQCVRDIILGAFPKHGFLGEENCSIPSQEDGLRWIVDPLDGTTNYVHAIPGYTVSIALEQAGKLLVGTVFDPVSGECFSAMAGAGATLNGRPMHVSRVERLEGAVVAVSFPPQMRRDGPELAQFANVAMAAQSVRRSGSAALNLAYIAAGRFDGYWSSFNKIWDVAAGILLVLEAGGTVTGVDGRPFAIDPPHIIAAPTPSLHAELKAVINAPTR
jgi:myo-inositol-1(or 4)-monophosphatase